MGGEAYVYSRILLVGAFFIFWDWSARGGLYNPLFTSYPSEILKDLSEFYISGNLVKHASITLREALTGLLYGTIIGVAVALILGQFNTSGKILLSIITAVNGIPQLTLAPVYILWFGLGITSKIFLAGGYGFFHVFFSSYAGVLNVDNELIESATASFIDNHNILSTNDFSKLTGEKYQKYDYLVIRPELIEISSVEYEKEKEYYYFYGNVIGLLPLGNIIRYTVEVGDNTLVVDDLNNRKEIYTISQSVFIRVKKTLYWIIDNIFSKGC